MPTGNCVVRLENVRAYYHSIVYAFLHFARFDIYNKPLSPFR